MKITYEDLTPGMRTINTARAICTIIGWIVAIAVFIIFTIWFTDLGYIKEPADILEQVVFLPAIFSGGLIVVFSHIQRHWSNIKPLLHDPDFTSLFGMIITLIKWLIWYFALALYVVFAGPVFLIINTFKLIFRIPLISEKDYYHFS